MALSITSPQHSFIQFGGSDEVVSCSHPGGSTCLPVYLETDIAFQFVVRADTEEEADELCQLDESGVVIGIAEDTTPLLAFDELPERYRLNAYEVLYNWAHGVPGFDTVVQMGGCFRLYVTVGEEIAYSNCLKRIPEDCYSSVLEYSADENVFGFFYCGGAAVDPDAVDCEPQFISFTLQSLITIPYNASMQARFGNIPPVSVFIRNWENELQLTSVAVVYDSYPATEISIDMGGPATGVVRIG